MDDKIKRVKRKGEERPLCSSCKVRKCVTKGQYPDGTQMYRKICYKCHGQRSRHRKIMRKILAELKCCKCSFIAIHNCQLDVDHIDQNNKNNDPSNLQVLCANCHRLKTHKERACLK